MLSARATLLATVNVRMPSDNSVRHCGLIAITYSMEVMFSSRSLPIVSGGVDRFILEAGFLCLFVTPCFRLVEPVRSSSRMRTEKCSRAIQGRGFLVSFICEIDGEELHDRLH
jgi:hypothetical protein